MKTDILLEPLPNSRYRATGLGQFALSVEGATRQEAMDNFQKAALALLPRNAEIVTLDIPFSANDIIVNHPWAWFAGSAKDDPLWDRYLEQMEINRQIDDENEARRFAEEEAERDQNDG